METKTPCVTATQTSWYCLWQRQISTEGHDYWVRDLCWWDSDCREQVRGCWRWGRDLGMGQGLLGTWKGLLEWSRSFWVWPVAPPVHLVSGTLTRGHGEWGNGKHAHSEQLESNGVCALLKPYLLLYTPEPCLLLQPKGRVSWSQ